jgi:hypothetical protein
MVPGCPGTAGRLVRGGTALARVGSGCPVWLVPALGAFIKSLLGGMH